LNPRLFTVSQVNCLTSKPLDETNAKNYVIFAKIGQTWGIPHCFNAKKVVE